MCFPLFSYMYPKGLFTYNKNEILETTMFNLTLSLEDWYMDEAQTDLFRLNTSEFVLLQHCFWYLLYAIKLI